MSDIGSFEAYVTELKARHDEGKIDDGQYFAGILGVANGYAERGRLDSAVHHIGLLPEEFLRAIPGSGREKLAATAVELAQRLRDAGIVNPPLSAAAGLQ
jgi:hypothetical protein